MTDRPKVGRLFAIPDRTAGLEHLLNPVPSPQTPATTPATTEARVAPNSALPSTRIVSIQLETDVRTRLRDFANRTGQTFGAITLRAIEAQADDLVSQWSRPTAPVGHPGLFPDAPAPRRRDRVSSQVQLRISPAATAIMDDLVARWDAPSRTALVNEALQRYLPTTAGAP